MDPEVYILQPQRCRIPYRFLAFLLTGALVLGGLFYLWTHLGL